MIHYFFLFLLKETSGMDRQTARLYRYQIQGVKSAFRKLTTGAKCLVVNVWYKKKREKEIKKKKKEVEKRNENHVMYNDL